MPLDVRLHGLWSTLAYFAGTRGVEGVEGTRQMKGVKVGEMKAKTEEAMCIAEQGREWAGRVLRKEDMEVYFYRLLLEWGRVTDDRREEIGFMG